MDDMYQGLTAMTDLIQMINPWGVWNWLAAIYATTVLIRTQGQLSLPKTAGLILAAVLNLAVAAAYILVEFAQ